MLHRPFEPAAVTGEVGTGTNLSGQIGAEIRTDTSDSMRDELPSLTSGLSREIHGKYPVLRKNIRDAN